MYTNIDNIKQPEKGLSEILLHINIPLTSYNEFAHHIFRALETIGKYSHHDRVHITEIHQNMTFSVQHEWCAQQIEAIPQKWKHAPIIHFPDWENQLNTQNYIIIRDSQDIEPDLHTFLADQNCQQMLLLPLFESGTQLAFLVFMQCKHIHNWQPEEIDMLADFSSIIAIQLNNYQILRRLLHKLKRYRQEKEPVKMLYHHLKHLQTEILPAWDKIKKTNPESAEISQLDQHLVTLDQLCHTLSEK